VFFRSLRSLLNRRQMTAIVCERSTMGEVLIAAE